MTGRPAAPPSLGSEAAARLGAYITEQRWSGARGERPEGVRVEAVVPLDDAACCVVRARVAGEDVRYQLWLPNAWLESPDRAPTDALRDEALRLTLARLVARGDRVDGQGAALVAEPEAEAAAVLEALSSSRVGSAEQSNTSIVYDGKVIVKLFRRLAAGAQPDVEVTRFLTRKRFAHTPPLLGTLTIEDAEGSSVAGMAQRFVGGAADAWAHAVTLARAAAHDGTDDDRGEEARRLGATTRALHDALASDDADPDFAPVRADRDTARRWADAAARSIDVGVALLRERLAEGALDGLPPPALAAARRVSAEGSERLAGVARAAAERAGDDAGCATRHHGDYHLGQVLRADDGTFYVIDFEGEPAKPLEERRARHSPLRDVAGMLRSFAYAAATAAIERPHDADVAARAAAWEHEARTAFLAGYFGPGTGGYLPRARASADALLTVFELEKAFYELHYELRNRPTWVLIPLAGIARLTHTTDRT
ncbi:trehalose synthase [Gemmatirosa kalamazoonensis]|uniref:Trehalose synthase n=1 Tax=Gemmatirosa kalamazoonensis TaxID=861299 RepID=W0RKR8_9BACT|nr:hypothetical protein [Gemmatirosa kalamazoonensis]AHG91351.1 trehalose synthase [Gemmatirosa kalamazoonensis]